MAGELPEGARPYKRRGTVPQGTCEHGFKLRPDTPRVLPADLHKPFVPSRRCANWARDRRVEGYGRAATGSSRKRRVFSCWGCLASF